MDDHIEVIGAKDDSRLYIKCPGIECHSTATGKRDTMLHTDGAPTIVCMHQSCAQAVESKNLELRRAFPSTVTRIAPHTDFRRQREIEAAKRAIAKASRGRVATSGKIPRFASQARLILRKPARSSAWRFPKAICSGSDSRNTPTRLARFDASRTGLPMNRYFRGRRFALMPWRRFREGENIPTFRSRAM
jgi:hypothetical protein